MARAPILTLVILGQKSIFEIITNYYTVKFEICFTLEHSNDLKLADISYTSTIIA